MNITDFNQDAAHVRLFVALETPESLKERLRAVQTELRQCLRGSSISWTKPEQFHLTLRFLGTAPGRVVPDLAHALGKVLAGNGHLLLCAKGIGCFPSLRRPRVIWVGLEGSLDVLTVLHKTVATACRPFTEADEKTFSPHLTLARVKAWAQSDGAALGEAARRLAGQVFGEWPVREAHLYRSVLGAGGAQHTVLASFAF